MNMYRFYDCSGNLLEETRCPKRIEAIKKIPWITYTVEKDEKN